MPPPDLPIISALNMHINFIPQLWWRFPWDFFIHPVHAQFQSLSAKNKASHLCHDCEPLRLYSVTDSANKVRSVSFVARSPKGSALGCFNHLFNRVRVLSGLKSCFEYRLPKAVGISGSTVKTACQIIVAACPDFEGSCKCDLTYSTCCD